MIKTRMLTVTLTELPTGEFPASSKVIYKAHRLFIGDEISPALKATEYLAKNIGLEPICPKEAK